MLYIDAEQKIIAAGPVLRFTDRLPSSPWTRWQVTARIVLRHVEGQYEVARQVLDDAGAHFEYQFALRYGRMFRGGDKAFVAAVTAFDLFVEANPPDLKPKQLGLVDGKVVVRTYDVIDPARKHEYAFQFEAGSGKLVPDTVLYRDDHNRIRKMVEYHFGEVKWLDAAAYAI